MFLVQQRDGVACLTVEHSNEPALCIAPLNVSREPRRYFHNKDRVPQQGAGLHIDVTAIPSLQGEHPHETVVSKPCA